MNSIRDIYIKDPAQIKAKELMAKMDSVIDKVFHLIVELGHDENDWDAVYDVLESVSENESHQFLCQLIERRKTQKGWDMFYIDKIIAHFNKEMILV